jgi:hypothetical protein
MKKRKLKNYRKPKKLKLNNNPLTLKEFLIQSYNAAQESLEWWEDDNSLTM